MSGQARKVPEQATGTDNHGFSHSFRQGRIQKTNSKGRVMNRSGAPTYTQNAKT